MVQSLILFTEGLFYRSLLQNLATLICYPIYKNGAYLMHEINCVYHNKIQFENSEKIVILFNVVNSKLSVSFWNTCRSNRNKNAQDYFVSAGCNQKIYLIS